MIVVQRPLMLEHLFCGIYTAYLVKYQQSNWWHLILLMFKPLCFIVIVDIAGKKINDETIIEYTF